METDSKQPSFIIVNDGSPVDIALSHGSAGSLYNTGKVTAEFDGVSLATSSGLCGSFTNAATLLRKHTPMIRSMTIIGIPRTSGPVRLIRMGGCRGILSRGLRRIRPARLLRDGNFIILRQFSYHLLNVLKGLDSSQCAPWFVYMDHVEVYTCWNTLGSALLPLKVALPSAQLYMHQQFPLRRKEQRSMLVRSSRNNAVWDLPGLLAAPVCDSFHRATDNFPSRVSTRLTSQGSRPYTSSHLQLPFS